MLGELRTRIPNVALVDPGLPDEWLMLIYAELVFGQGTAQAERAIAERSGAVAAQSEKHVQLARAMVKAIREKNPNPVRSAWERFAQRYPDVLQTPIPSILDAFDHFVCSLDKGGDYPEYDYSVSSYTLWQDGLRFLAAGRFSLAAPALSESIDRYRLGGMLGDVLWSWYDTIVAFLLLDRLSDAEKLYKDYEGIGSDSSFPQMAELMIKAYKERDRQIVTTVIDVLASGWPDYVTSPYPAIFAHFEAHLSQMPDPEALESGSAPEKETLAIVRARRTTPYRFLLARPARSRPAEIEAVERIASYVNLGATRPSPGLARAQVAISDETLTGRVPWRQGLLFLVTEAAFPDSPSQRSIVAACKLQRPVDACWSIVPRVRVVERKFTSRIEVLVFDDTPSKALEMAANAVDPPYRGTRIGTFQVHARLLYLIEHPPKDINTLYANLLAPDIDGHYPFYEEVVRPFLLDLNYDDADNLRYANAHLISELLGPADATDIVSQIPLHVLSGAARESFAQVRPITQRVQRSLERYGFRRANKFDLLDAGQYFELPMIHLLDPSFVQRLAAKPESEMPEDLRPRWDEESGMRSFVPSGRPPIDFICCRGRALVSAEDQILYIDSLAFSAAGIAKAEAVLLIEE